MPLIVIDYKTIEAITMVSAAATVKHKAILNMVLDVTRVKHKAMLNNGFGSYQSYAKGNDNGVGCHHS